jgi:hypothetical protein
MITSSADLSTSTGVSNTRLTTLPTPPPVIGIDYLKLCNNRVLASDFRSFVANLESKLEFLVQWDRSFPHHDGNTLWQNCFSTTGGDRILSTPDGEGFLRVVIELRSTTLRALPAVTVHSYMVTMISYNYRCSRIDIAIDDYSKQLKPLVLRQCRIDGRIKHCRPTAKQKDYFGNDFNVGFTVYIGSRESDRFVRFYDKNERSGGAINAYRYEAQFMQGHAHKIFSDLCSFSHTPSMLVQATRFCLGVFDYFDDDYKKQRCSWWQDFIDYCLPSGDVGGIRYRISALAPTLTTVVDYVKRQASGALSLIRHLYGTKEFIRWMLDDDISGRSINNLSYHYQRISKAHTKRDAHIILDQPIEYQFLRDYSVTS